MHEIATIDYIIIAFYLAGMVGVGLWFAKKHTDFEDFFLAGRSLTTPLLITTLISTYYGIDVLFGSLLFMHQQDFRSWLNPHFTSGYLPQNHTRM